MMSNLILMSTFAASVLAQGPTNDPCYPKMRSAYEAYTTKGKNGLIEYLYTDYMTGTKPGVYCYSVNGTDPSESIVVGTFYGNPTAVPGQVSFSVSASLNKTRWGTDLGRRALALTLSLALHARSFANKGRE